jgi:hypothetical protein
MSEAFFFVSRLLFFAVLLALTGCAYPLGLTKEEWRALPPAEKFKYAELQRQIDAENFQRAEAERQRRDLEQMEKEAALTDSQPDVMLSINRNVKLGLNFAHDRSVIVRIHDGQIAFGGRLANYDPVSVRLADGETRTVKLTEQGRPSSVVSFRVRLENDGRAVVFDTTALFPFRAGRTNAWKGGQDYLVPDIRDATKQRKSRDVHITVRLRANE